MKNKKNLVRLELGCLPLEGSNTHQTFIQAALPQGPTPYTLIQFNLSTTATLGTEESGCCREIETRVNVWAVCQKNWPL